MKLEIKHLAPYLPYGLNLIFEKSGRIITMLSCFNNGQLQIVDTGEGNTYDLSVWNFKPLLYSIDKFERFESITDEMSENEINALQRLLQFKVPPAGGYVHQVNVGAYLKMFENHVDVFNLIPNGLAVSKNEI